MKSVRYIYFFLIISLLGLGLASRDCVAQLYTYEIIAKTGDTIVDANPAGAGNIGPLDMLAWGPSINDNGAVAFIPLAGTDKRVMVKAANGAILKNYLIQTWLSLSQHLELNDTEQVSFQLTDYTYDYLPKLKTLAIRLDAMSLPGQPIIAYGETGNSGTPYDYVDYYTSINNYGRVVYSANLDGILPNRVIGEDDDGMGPGGDHETVPFPGEPVLMSPMISNDNKTIVRWGPDFTPDLRLWLDETLVSYTPIAESPDFVRVGARPGISDDGKLMGFFAEHSTSGYRLFLATITPQDELIRHALYFIPSSTYLNFRIGINKSYGGVQDDYRVVYAAQDAATLNYKLMSFNVNISDPWHITYSTPTVIAEVGEVFAPLGETVVDLSIYDPVNNNGEVVFWVQTTSQIAIVKATAVNFAPVFDPIENQLTSEENALNFGVAAHDANGDPVTLSATLADGSPLSTVGATFDANTGEFDWTPSAGQGVQSYSIKFRAEDPYSLFDEETITITVQGSGTIISDHVFNDTTWDLVHAPYIVTTVIAVDNLATLTIVPDVVVRFYPGAGIDVGPISAGNLIAQGTAGHPIQFISNEALKLPGQWEKILLRTGASLIEHVEVKHSKFGIYQSVANYDIANSIFAENIWGMTIASGSSPNISDNIFQGNLNGDCLVVSGVNAGTPYVSLPVLRNNQFISSSVWKVYSIVTSPDDLSAYTIDAQNNYWGTTDINVIAQWVWDGTDTGNEHAPVVDYTPFLSAP
ncbi:MAG: hypothetical protein K8S27_00195 [Candidatus Omnitrophica bacterium]|nr:hypothetical protein [Candidatus Omnitrophota bacterium]